FPSMGRAPDAKGGATRLVGVKAVSAGYPLRGELSLRAGEGSIAQNVARAPDPGTVWVDQALLDGLSLKVGDLLLLGDTALRITQVIVIEPDRGTGITSFAPRVMLNAADLASTGLVRPDSRLSVHILIGDAVGTGTR